MSQTVVEKASGGKAFEERRQAGQLIGRNADCRQKERSLASKTVFNSIYEKADAIGRLAECWTEKNADLWSDVLRAAEKETKANRYFALHRLIDAANKNKNGIDAGRVDFGIDIPWCDIEYITLFFLSKLVTREIPDAAPLILVGRGWYCREGQTRRTSPHERGDAE